jgi:hypothetical protein
LDSYIEIDFGLCIRNSLPVLYVDDTTLAISGFTNEIDLIVSRLEEDLSRAVGWLGGSRLSINDDKSELMPVGKKTHILRVNPIVKVNGKVLRRVESMKILGVIIDCNLDCQLHLKKVSRSCNYSLSLLYPLRSVLSYDSRKLLATALTLSHLNYNSCVWYNCSS